MRHWLEIVSAALFALAGARLILLGLGRWLRWPDPKAMSPSRDTAVFVFEGEELVGASPAARRLLEARRSGRSDLAAVTDLLSRGFGDTSGGRPDLPSEDGRFHSAPGPADITGHDSQQGGLDRLSFAAAQEELAILRGIAEDAPQPIWALDATGAVAWANRAYLDLAEAARPSVRSGAAEPSGASALWPAEPIIRTPDDLAEGQVHLQRLPLALSGREEPLWFDLTSVGRGAGSLHFAADVGRLVQAESARLHFVQALAKTFADLATGLAIFDRKRQLVLFNPAFVDLTGLPVTFLSGRPLVQTVLDRLREAKILPEPRDYSSWREEVAALEAAAAQGGYADIWALPSGRTYKVTGRPHPDGALAFLFEDITDELGLTRRLRDELDMMRAALDDSGEAMAVVASAGELIHGNAAYRDLWGSPAPSSGPRDFMGEVLRWEAACLPSTTWTRLREESRGPIFEDVLRHRDGRCLGLRITPLPHGARLLRFRHDFVWSDAGEGATAFRLKPAQESRMGPAGNSGLPETGGKVTVEA